MKLIIIDQFLLVCFLFLISKNYVQSQQQRSGSMKVNTNADPMRITTATLKLQKDIQLKLCTADNFEDDMISKIEECNNFDPHYRMNKMFKECQDMSLQLNEESTWNEKRRMNCQVRECYGRLQRTPQHLMALTEIQNMTDSDMDARMRQKYDCLKSVLSMNGQQQQQQVDS